jgi:hypothetical protein
MTEKGAATLLQITRDLLDKCRQECHRRELALQSLTPGGSEYVNDPERCVSFVKNVRDKNFELIKQFKLERDEALARLASLEEEKCPVSS